MGRPILVWTASDAIPAPAGAASDGCALTSHDRIALTCWMQRADMHGYRRMLIEDGAPGGSPAEAAYVLVYAPHSDWARWGLARGKRGVTVWDCGTGADVGAHATMFDALRSLPACGQAGPRRPSMDGAAIGTEPALPRSRAVNSA